MKVVMSKREGQNEMSHLKKNLEKSIIQKIRRKNRSVGWGWGDWGITRPTQARSQENKETPCIRKRKQLCT